MEPMKWHVWKYFAQQNRKSALQNNEARSHESAIQPVANENANKHCNRNDAAQYQRLNEVSQSFVFGSAEYD